MKEIIMILAIWVILSAANNYYWQKSLERRERRAQRLENALAKIVMLQSEQVNQTQHLLNGQKLRYAAMNKQAKEIQSTLEEVNKIAGSIKSDRERRGRRSKRKTDAV